MSEINLRQLGNESRVLYRKDRTFVMQSETANEGITIWTNLARSDHKVLEALKIAIAKPESAMAKQHVASYGDTPERLQVVLEEVSDDQDSNFLKIGEAVLEQSLVESERAEHNRKAARHYERNAAAYHDLAVIEAQLDGVVINISQPESEEIQVHH